MLVVSGMILKYLQIIVLQLIINRYRMFKLHSGQLC